VPIGFEPIVDKLKQNLGWTCKVNFKDGIKRILERTLFSIHS
jgi:hypothetical protein